MDREAIENNETAMGSNRSFFPKTMELLKNEIRLLTEARDGVGKAWNVLKIKGIEDEYLRKLYNEFDDCLKEYEISIGILVEETERGSVRQCQ